MMAIRGYLQKRREWYGAPGKPVSGNGMRADGGVLEGWMSSDQALLRDRIRGMAMTDAANEVLRSGDSFDWWRTNK
jgi:hypothetical protein